jgi:AcrR family transcriptional regulator
MEPVKSRPAKSRREQYSDATKAALLEAATRRFAEHGFSGTALEEVAADVQATRGAVYHHFANKIALFQAVYEELETGMIRDVAEATKNAATPEEAAYAALNTFLDHASEPVYGRIVWQEAPLALGWQQWREREEQYGYGMIEQVLRNLLDTGQFEDLPFEPAVRITFHVVGAAGMALAEAPEQDKERLKAEYGEVMMRMLSGMRR